MSAGNPQPAPVDQIDPEERVELLLRDLSSAAAGLSSREADRRLVQFGPNVLIRRGGRHWPRELARQFTHPLALLLWAAAALAWAAGIAPVAIAIVVVIVINAAFAFVQEVQAERAVEALAQYLPDQARVLRDGDEQRVDADRLVPGDVLVIEEGDRISADARLLTGGVEVDLSTLTGESVPVFRVARLQDTSVPVLEARDLVFSGTTCTGGDARALVFATGLHTELGRIAALSERVEKEESPLEAQVRRVAWLIALIAVCTGLMFVPVATLAAGLPLSDAVVFAVGLLVGNVPEGLLPVITLALAVGVRELVRRGAVVKRLSAVETLGSTSVICTDKTGTLTENRMRVTRIWTAPRTLDVESGDGSLPTLTRGSDDGALLALAQTMAACNNAQPDGSAGDPTELAMLAAAAQLGTEPSVAERERRRRRQFHFDPVLKLMSTVDEREDRLWVDAKGAPEALLPRCSAIVWGDGRERPLGQNELQEVERIVEDYAGQGLRVLAVAQRRLRTEAPLPEGRDDAESDLCLLGLVAMLDPPRSEVPDAVARCQHAGIRIIVVTGDHGLTAATIARRVGIVRGPPAIVTGAELARMSEDELDQVFLFVAPFPFVVWGADELRRWILRRRDTT